MRLYEYAYATMALGAHDLIPHVPSIPGSFPASHDAPPMPYSARSSAARFRLSSHRAAHEHRQSIRIALCDRTHSAISATRMAGTLRFRLPGLSLR
jgi:hypothetical protein